MTISDVGTLCVALSAQCFGIGAALTKYVDVHALLFDAVRAPLLWVACIISVLIAWKQSTAWRSMTSNTSLQDTLLLGGQKQLTLDEYIFGGTEFRLLLFLRGLAYWAFELFWFSAVMNMPIGDATCIAFSLSPLLSAKEGQRSLFPKKSLSKELFWTVGQRNGLPSISDDTVVSTYWTGVTLAVACACCACTIPVMTKRLASCHWTTVEHVTQIWRAFVLTPVGVLLLWVFDSAAFEAAWQMLLAVLLGHDGVKVAQDGTERPRPYALLAMIGASIVFYAALTLQIYGYQRATHTQRANMTAYLEILTAFLFQHFLFEDEVNVLAAVGALTIAGAGIANVVHKPQAPKESTEE